MHPLYDSHSNALMPIMHALVNRIKDYESWSASIKRDEMNFYPFHFLSGGEMKPCLPVQLKFIEVDVRN